MPTAEQPKATTTLIAEIKKVRSLKALEKLIADPKWKAKSKKTIARRNRAYREKLAKLTTKKATA